MSNRIMPYDREPQIQSIQDDNNSNESYESSDSSDSNDSDDTYLCFGCCYEPDYSPNDEYVSQEECCVNACPLCWCDCCYCKNNCCSGFCANFDYIFM